MEEITRRRIMRLLEGLPEERLYQVLDYIEFLAVREARGASREPDAFQRFAERVEDQMRFRSVAPKAMRGTMRIMSTAGRVLDGMRGLGRDVVSGLEGGGAGDRPAAKGSEGRSSPEGARDGSGDASAVSRSGGPGSAGEVSDSS